MTREDVAKAYLASAHAHAARVGVICFGVALALVTVWAAQLVEKPDEVLGALGRLPGQQRLVRRQQAAVQRQNLARSRTRTTTLNQTARLKNYLELSRSTAESYQRQTRGIAAGIRQASTVTFKLPGLPDVTVRDSLAAVTWLGCAMALLYYLSLSRQSILRLYSRALRILSAELSTPAHVLRDVAGPLPFWVAPLPHRDGTRVTSAQLRSAAGWDHSAFRSHVCVAALQLLALALVIHVTYLGIAFSQLQEPVSSQRLVVNVPLLPLTILCAVVCGGLALWWVVPSAVPDQFAHEAPTQPSRRQLLIAAGGGVAGFAALMALPPAYVRRVLLAPHFRRWRNRSALPVGFYAVGKAGRVVHVNRAGRPVRLKSVPDTYIAHVEVDRSQFLSLEPAAIRPWLRAAAEKFNTEENSLVEEGITQTNAAALAGAPWTFTWYDYAFQSAPRPDAPRTQRILQSLQALSASVADPRSKQEIANRQRAWRERV